MDILVIAGALFLLTIIAYRGFSVILFAPLIALGAVLCFEPLSVFPAYIGIFMERAAFFVQTYFPMFLLGAIFGKVIELSGFSKSIVAMMFNLVGSKRAILAIMLVAAVLSWGGVSAFVIVFAVYPLASEFFRMSNIPKRLIPCVIWLGGITFTMDTLPGSPQIHNIIPTYFFGTDAYAAPVLGFIGSLFIGGVGFLYIEWMRRKALANNEGYDSGQPLYMEPEPYTQEKLPKFWIAIIPLIVVAIANFYFTNNLVNIFGAEYHINFPGMKSPLALDITKGVSLWAVVIAMFLGIITVFILAFKPVASRFAEGTKSAVSGSLLAIMNTGSEFGYGSIIAVLPGFLLFSELLKGISQPPGK